MTSKLVLLVLLAEMPFSAEAADAQRADCYDVKVVARAIEQIPSVIPECDDCIIMRWPWFVDLQVKRVVEGNVDRKPLRVLTVQHTWMVSRYSTWRLRRNNLGGFNAVFSETNSSLRRCPAEAAPAVPYIRPAPN